MKKTYYITILGVALIALFGATIALAEGTSSASSTDSRWSKYFEQKKEKLDEQKAKLASTTARIENRIKEKEDRLASSTIKLADREQRVASSTEARRARLEDKFKTGVANKIAKVNDRLADAIERLTGIDARLKTHIAVLKAKNVDTTKADALLVTAEAKLVTAKEKVSALKTSLDSILSTTISTSTKDAIKAKTEEANTSVKAAHQAFVLVVESLKPGENKVATSTATTTP